MAKKPSDRTREGIAALKLACSVQHQANEKGAGPQIGLPFQAPCVCGRNSSGCPACLGLRDIATALDQCLMGHYNEHPKCDCEWAATADLTVRLLLGHSPRVAWEQVRPRAIKKR